MKKIESYFAKHVYFNSAVHVLVGMGIGVLLTYPVFGAHTMRWGLGLLVLGLLGHAYPILLRSKLI